MGYELASEHLGQPRKAREEWKATAAEGQPGGSPLVAVLASARRTDSRGRRSRGFSVRRLSTASRLQREGKARDQLGDSPALSPQTDGVSCS